MVEGRKQVCAGSDDFAEDGDGGVDLGGEADFSSRAGVSDDEFCDLSCRYLMISRILPGRELRVIIVVTPALVARRAATIFVLIPPVPNEEPAEDTSAVRVEMSDTTSITCASGLVRGLDVYKPSTSVIRNR